MDICAAIHALTVVVVQFPSEHWRLDVKFKIVHQLIDCATLFVRNTGFTVEIRVNNVAPFSCIV